MTTTCFCIQISFLPDGSDGPLLSFSFCLALSHFPCLSLFLYSPLPFSCAHTHSLTLFFYTIVCSLTEGISRSKDNVFSVLHDESLLNPTPPSPARFLSFICGLCGSVVWQNAGSEPLSGRGVQAAGYLSPLLLVFVVDPWHCPDTCTPQRSNL